MQTESIDKSRWLADIHLNVDVVIEKGCLAVDVQNVKHEECGDCEESTYRFDSDHRSKCFFKVETRNLRIFFGAQPGLISFETVVLITFCLQNSFDINSCSFRG